jgi:hypothetical protein
LPIPASDPEAWSTVGLQKNNYNFWIFLQDRRLKNVFFCFAHAACGGAFGLARPRPGGGVMPFRD